MALPTKDQISIAIEDNNNILDPSLAGFKTIDGIVGPECYSGGFCLVFPVTNGSDKYAFRVWHTEIDGIKDRLAKIASYLSSHKSPYFVDFDFVSKGLRVPTEDSTQDIEAIKMKWVNGKNLSQYLEYLINESGLTEDEVKQQISNLADKFLEMVKTLHGMGISHGDLQHGNIMVDENLNLILVDYDSVFVPTFAGEIQVTSGMAAYQHPIRKNGLYEATAKDDYFSERVIYLSLLALAENPSIWESLKDDEGEKDEHSLLLTENDIENFTQCALYSTFKKLHNPRIDTLCDDIADALKSASPNGMEPIEVLFVDKYGEQPPSVTIDPNDWADLAPKEPPRYKKNTVSVEPFDEGAAMDRYSQN